MVMVKNDYDVVCLLATFFLVSVLLVSWWSLDCVSVVVGVLVALWWCVHRVLTVFGDVLATLCYWGCMLG